MLGMAPSVHKPNAFLPSGCLREPKEKEHIPRPVPLFRPDRILLTKGWDRTPQQARLAEGICAAYPHAEVVDRADRSHNHVDLGCDDSLVRHRTGKRTLVLGEHKSPVRFSDEQRVCCPNYWHFSPYGFCPYGCTYCYLAGTRGVWFSPTVKVFLNLDEMLARINRTARRLARPVAFYLGKLQDGLALDPLTGYSRRLVPFFAAHPYAHLIVLTKSGQVDDLLDLAPEGHTILSWSLTPEALARRYEPSAPTTAARLAAMRRCAAAGYRLRAVVMPILPVRGWRCAYGDLLQELLGLEAMERVTLGSLCSFPNAMRLMMRKLGRQDELSASLARLARSQDGRYRFPPKTRTDCYRFLLRIIAQGRPSLEVGLCLEQAEVLHRAGLERRTSQCNCVL